MRRVTTDITELTQSLKAAAEKATPGPWGVARDGKTLVSNQSHPIVTLSDAMHRMLTDGSTGKDAEFIALANPANIRALVEALEKAQQRIEVLLATMEVEPVENHIGSKNALDAIVSFIKSKSNPTGECYEEVSEQLFKDNCHGIHSHVIEYILKLGEELEDLRAEQAETQPAPVVPEEAYSDDCPELYPSQPDAWAAGWNACRAAMLNQK